MSIGDGDGEHWRWFTGEPEILWKKLTLQNEGRGALLSMEHFSKVEKNLVKLNLLSFAQVWVDVGTMIV